MLSARLCRSLGRGKEGGGGVEEAMRKHMKSKNTRKLEKADKEQEAHKEAMMRHIILVSARQNFSWIKIPGEGARTPPPSSCFTINL